ncbi:hypothetical protein ABIF78_007704 [Bradyrhizobium japonicum]
MSNVHAIETVNPKLPLCLFELRDQYGATVVRPVGIVAETFAEIAGTKTLTPHALRNIRKLGYRIVIEGKAA